jgi:putative two-component system response regulator
MCIDGYQAAGQPDVALEYLRELSDLTKAQQHAQLRQQLQRVGMVPGDDDADQRLQQKAWDLADQVRRKEEVLVESAVRAALASGYDARRPFRVAKLAELFAMHEGTGSETVAQWKLAALLADIGMVAIPARLVARKGSLAGDERALVHEHVRYGAQLVEEAGLTKHRPCIELIRSHHERWDGTGPLQLRAADIPLGAQVIALADAYDALTHDRPWRRAKTVQEAVFEIGEASGQFDPDLAKRFTAFIRQEFWAHRDFEAFLGEEATSSSFVRATEQIGRMLSQDKNPE